MVRDILQLSTQPTGMIISGDCAASRGKIGDYKQLIEYLKPLRESGIKVHAALGNHDNRENFLQAFPEVITTKKNPHLKAKTVWNDNSTSNTKQVDVIETKHANWFILDSLVKTNETPGSFGKQQLKWLADELDTRREKPALIVAHHNPDVLVGQGLLDTPEFAKVINSRQQVKAYIFGHTHFWDTSRIDKLQLINLPSTAWLFNNKAVLAWVVATLHEKGITLELKTIDKKDKRNDTKVEINYEV
jgi:3',5'-cyclic AMP phosphodiesterase CpdA